MQERGGVCLLCFSVGLRLVPWPRGAGVWFSHLTAACIPGRGQGQGPGYPGGDTVFVCVHSTVVFHFVMGLGFSQAFLPDQGFKNTSVQ